MTTSASVFRLARRLEGVGFSDIVQIRNKVMELRARGASVYRFEGGEPFLNTPDPIKEAMARALRDNKTRYAPSSGITQLRAAIAAKLRERNRINARESDVIVLNGGMQGLFGAFQSVVNPGDEVLVFSPYWTPIRDLIAHCEGAAVLVPVAEAREAGFAETLARYSTERTRALYFNTPQNPNGVVFTRVEAEAVARFARERDLVVIADEAYEDLVYEGEHVSVASLEGMFERTITCFTLSKSYAMTGWRVGYVAGAASLLQPITDLKLALSICSAAPSQWAALAALTGPQDATERMRAELAERLPVALAGLEAMGLPHSKPRGAYYVFVDIRPTGLSSAACARLFQERAGVRMLPGHLFGPLHLLDQLRVDPVAAADEAHPHTLAVELGRLVGDPHREHVHQALDLGGRARPVLGGERVDGELLDPQVGGVAQPRLDRVGAGLVAGELRQAPPARPAAVAIGDDRDVARSRSSLPVGGH